MSWGDETTVFDVVINHEEQYSIWPSYKPIPEGWRAVGRQGPKAECLAYIDEVWTDMRPLSLRRAMEAREAGGDAPAAQ
ncbi:MbtH family NRPS accessory protein (plasmid) [Tistrella mobilis]|jgi:MbtH protein|uniref:MbtH domain-containing protein n=1 Tax=Tistrella mobilis TaxID=171437 RepID=A0A162LSB1_9PROT|nr:MbtH family NRPS accessory protein [Tistrella mobilis]KYO56758.1 MbtH domain-containing protein [Tistrella mobilis]